MKIFFNSSILKKRKVQNIELYLITMLIYLQYIIQYEERKQFKMFDLNRTNYSALRGIRAISCTGEHRVSGLSPSSKSLKEQNTLETESVPVLMLKSEGQVLSWALYEELI
jgi:hypothetical protein